MLRDCIEPCRKFHEGNIHFGLQEPHASFLTESEEKKPNRKAFMKVNTGTESSGMTMTLIRSGEKRNEKELRWEASGMKD